MSDSSWLHRELAELVEHSDHVIRDAWIHTSATPPKRDEVVGAVAFQPGKRGLLRDRLVEMIGSAESFIVIASFLIASPPIEAAILDASDRGVRVYILTASEQRLANEPKS